MTVSQRGKRAPADGSVRVETDGPLVAISVFGPLDGDTGRALVLAARTALHAEPDRVDIDLQAVDSFTDEGAAALAECRDLGGGLPDGLHYRTAVGPGGDAVLAAFEETA